MRACALTWKIVLLLLIKHRLVAYISLDIVSASFMIIIIKATLNSFVELRPFGVVNLVSMNLVLLSLNLV